MLVGGGGLAVVDATLAAAAGNDDGRTVHVHLAVSDLVEPSPCEGIFARSDALWDAVIERGWIGGVGVATDVACAGGGTAALDGVDDLEV